MCGVWRRVSSLPLGRSGERETERDLNFLPVGAPIHVFADHTHYVQGVAWDPLGQYVATQSSDRYDLVASAD